MLLPLLLRFLLLNTKPMVPILRHFFVIIAFLLGSPGALGASQTPPTAASAKTLLVLGVIASANPDHGVALLKNLKGGEAFAVRVGEEVAPGVFIKAINDKFVLLKVGTQEERVNVGEQMDTAVAVAAPAPAPGSADLVVDPAGTGIEKSGNVVHVSSSLRDRVAGAELSKVMMQAAAVPFFENGVLVGFRLWDIEPGSLYQRAGFVDGDIVTSINGQHLSDVGLAIRVLQSLRNQTNADISYIRNGAEQKIQIVIQ